MRQEFQRLDGEHFDLLVVGGGIYGAWTAYDAALRGLRVALVEAEDWGAGTSSASSKLIHGGLRYLEQGRLGMVRRALAERRTLIAHGPHRVHPLQLLLPLHRGSRAGRFRLSLGLWLYDLLAGQGRELDNHRFVDRDDLLDSYPFIAPEGLKGGFLFQDAQTDDARLTLEVVDGARGAGASVVNHARVVEFLQICKSVVGARIRDGEEGTCVEVRASVTMNCAGPWAGELVRGARPGALDRVRLSKGVHLVLPALPTRDAMLLLSQGHGGVVFLLPWYGRTLVGTTDADYTGDPAAVRVEPEERRYLLARVNQAMQQTRWTEGDIVAEFAGLRTLPLTQALVPSAVTREMIVDEPVQGMLMPIGGKLTSARSDSAKLVDRAILYIDRPGRRGAGTDRPLPWKPSGPYRTWAEKSLHKGIALGLDEETARNCLRRFGSRCKALFETLEASPDLARRIVGHAPFCMAEVVHAVRHEMALTLKDIVRRRIPLLLVAPPDEETLRAVAELAGRQLGWSDKRVRDEIATLNATPANHEPD